MADEERRELSELRATLNSLSAQLQQLDARLRRAEASAETADTAPGRERPATGAGARVESTPEIAASAHYGHPPEPPRTPGRFERRARALLTEGNPLNKLGALSLILGSIIVFKYAVDNQWIGPTGRVAIGFLVGAALFSLGEYYARRAWSLFASGLVGAGNGVLFASVYFGQQQYAIVPASMAFGLYVILTAAVVVQSLRYDAMGLAVWGLIGGYLTPVLASTGSGNYALLSTYLLVLDTGVFAVGYRRNWQPLKWMAFILTALYSGVWVIDYLDHAHRTPWLEFRWLLPYLGAFFVYFAAIPTWRSLLKREPIDAFGQALTVANGVVYFGFAALLLYEEHRAWLGLVSVLATISYAFVSSRLVRQPVIDSRGLRVFAGTAAGFLLLATPFLATGPAITIVWCAETVFLAWACTQPRLAFLRVHVLAMLGIISVRLIGFDSLLAPNWVDPQHRYIPFTQLASYPPFAAAATFALVARFLGRLGPLGERRDAGISAGAAAWVLGAGLLVLMAAVHAEAFRLSRFALAPYATRELHNLIEAGLLVAVMSALWFGLVKRLAGDQIPSILGLCYALLLSAWVMGALVWPGSYGGMLRILGEGYGLWWLHLGTFLMLPLALLFAAVGRSFREPLGRLSAEQLQLACFVAASLIGMLLLRREVFAITHAPPIADFFPDSARLASYRMLLSMSYAFLAFGIYLHAVRAASRPRLYGAYALYVVTAFKVYVFDLESQNQLYRACSLLVFAAILFVSSYFANRQGSATAERGESA